MARAEAGDPKAQFELARRLWVRRRRAGKHEKLDAMQWYRRAAQSGHRDAQVELGGILLDPDLRFYDVSEGFRWMTRAAEQGHVRAQYFLGVQFATGEMVKLNPKNALYWYRKAAAAGDAEAQYNIGMMYWGGEGVRKNPAMARKWIVKAAKNGEILAVILLARAYETAELGFRKNSKKARYWKARDRRLLGRSARRSAA